MLWYLVIAETGVTVGNYVLWKVDMNGPTMAQRLGKGTAKKLSFCHASSRASRPTGTVSGAAMSGL